MGWLLTRGWLPQRAGGCQAWTAVELPLRYPHVSIRKQSFIAHGKALQLVNLLRTRSIVFQDSKRTEIAFVFFQICLWLAVRRAVGYPSSALLGERSLRKPASLHHRERLFRQHWDDRWRRPLPILTTIYQRSSQRYDISVNKIAD